jgi:hypothetical protein
VSTLKYYAFAVVALLLLAGLSMANFASANPIVMDYPYNPQNKIDITMDTDTPYEQNFTVSFTVDLSAWSPYYIADFNPGYSFSSYIICHLDDAVVYDKVVSFGATSENSRVINCNIPLENVSTGTHTVLVEVTSIGTYWHTINHVYNKWDAPVYTSVTATITVEADPPVILLTSPENNKVYFGNNIWLNMTIDKPHSRVVYCLDGQENITITGNMTLPYMDMRVHNLTVYVWDNFGNVGTSQTVTFAQAELITPPPTGTIDPPLENWTILGIATSTIIIVCILSLLYVKKHKPQIAKK